MADVSCAIEQITQTDMEYDDLVQVDASPEENIEGPTDASPYYYFLREEKNSSNNSQTLKRSRTKSPYWVAVVIRCHYVIQCHQVQPFLY